MSQIIADTLKLIADNQDVILSAMRLAATNKEITMATLKVSDLSVGDWVRYDGKEYQVQCVDGLSEMVTLFGYCEQREESADNLRSIPITADILETNGFMRCSDEFNIYEYTTLLGKILRTTQVHLTTPQSINVFLHDTTIERGYYHREKTSVYILRDELYVHDIQHALRLAGVDKEINL